MLSLIKVDSADLFSCILPLFTQKLTQTIQIVIENGFPAEMLPKLLRLDSIYLNVVKNSEVQKENQDEETKIKNYLNNSTDGYKLELKFKIKKTDSTNFLLKYNTALDSHETDFQ